MFERLRSVLEPAAYQNAEVQVVIEAAVWDWQLDVKQRREAFPCPDHWWNRQEWSLELVRMKAAHFAAPQVWKSLKSLQFEYHLTLLIYLEADTSSKER